MNKNSMEELGDRPPPEEGASSIRILLVDDNEEFRRQAARFLSAIPRCSVEAVAASGREAIELARPDRFDLVLMDLSMPGMGGFEATLRIKERPGAPRVVIASLGRGDAYRIASEAARADGFISKADFAREIGPLLDRLFPDRYAPGESAP